MGGGLLGRCGPGILARWRVGVRAWALVVRPAVPWGAFWASWGEPGVRPGRGAGFEPVAFEEALVGGRSWDPRDPGAAPAKGDLGK